MAFLSAGGLFVTTAAVFGFEATTGTNIDVAPAIVFLFLLVVFLGSLGLYPRLAEQDPTLANGGVVLLALTAAVLISALGVFALSTGGSPRKSTVLASVMTVAIGSTLTLTAFGIASLRTGSYSRAVGSSLLVMAAALSFMIGATVVYGDPTPAWVGFVVNGLFATSLGAIGYVLRTEDGRVEHAEATGDAIGS